MEQTTPVPSTNQPSVNIKDLFARRGEVTLQLAILQQELNKIDAMLQQSGVAFPRP